MLEYQTSNDNKNVFRHNNTVFPYLNSYGEHYDVVFIVHVFATFRLVSFFIEYQMRLSMKMTGLVRGKIIDRIWYVYFKVTLDKYYNFYTFHANHFSDLKAM